MRLRTRYTMLAVLLGFGAPLGSLAWRTFTGYQGSIVSALTTEWRSATFYYVYMTVGTIVVFGLYGLLLGRHDEKLSTLSTTDGLTGVYNHRYLHERLAVELLRSNRYHSPLTCLMIDIDDFKKVNDRHGHPSGDVVLATTARLIQDTVRETDLVGRYGGEEFLVIMPQTTSEAALLLAGRILKNVWDHEYQEEAGTFRITVSIGLATYPAPELGVKSKSGLLSAADQALYKAKLSGKNQAADWAAMNADVCT